MVHEYPYTDYSNDMNCGMFMGLCSKAGVKLAFVGDSLQLLDKCNHVLSSVKIQIAQSALKDSNGNDLTAYFINAGTREETLVFTKGNGDEVVVRVPWAEVAKMDENGNEINDYAYSLSTVGDNLIITRGDGVTYNLTIPFATKASTDINNKPLTTYAASMEVSGNNVILKDGNGTIISTITVHFAERAAADENGANIRESYGASLQSGTTTIKMLSKAGDLLSEITVPYSTVALQDTNGNTFLHDYAESLVINNDGKRLDLLAHDGTLLSSITVPFSTLSTDATNAIERAEIVGDQLVLTTYGGEVTRLQISYALKAFKDAEDNEIAETYIANVLQNQVTGEINFYDAKGNIICTLIPQSRVAEYDTYDNLIADYIKTLVFDSQSKYLVATHGDGTVNSIIIEYSTSAWKDDIGNIIKNVYIKTLFIEEDNEGNWNLVGLNGEGSEICRLILPELTANVGSGLVINAHQISLTQEVKDRIYDFTYNSQNERLDITTHILIT